MRPQNLELVFEISLLLLYFSSLLFLVPVAYLTFALVGELTAGTDPAAFPLGVSRPRVYLLLFSEFAVPVITLLVVGWAIRHYVARGPNEGEKL